MIKKSLSVGLVGLMFLLSSIGVFAAEYEQTYGDNGGITITGETSANTLVGIQVFKPGKTIIDLLTNLGAASDYVEYNDQVLSDAQGKYTFKFNMLGDSGIYTAHIIDDSGMPETLEIMFVNSVEYNTFLSRLNKFAADKNYADFYTEFTNSDTYFKSSFNSIKENISMKDASDRLCDYVSSHPLSANDAISPSMIYNTYIAIQAAKEGMLSGIVKNIDNIYFKSRSQKWLEFVSGKPVASAHMDAVMNSLKPETLDQFSDALLEAMILAVIRDSGGYHNTENIMKEYTGFLGIEELTTAKYKTLAGGKYLSKTELQNAAKGINAVSGTNNNDRSVSGGAKYNASGKVPAASFEVTDDNHSENRQISIPFEDIDGVSWATEAITALYDRKIIDGKTETRFYPEDRVTREEFVKMVVAALNIEQEEDTGEFADVEKGAWFSGYVYAALKKGFVKGIDVDKFGSGLNITRQDIAVILCNAIPIPSVHNSVDFADASNIADYAKLAVEKLAGAGIINGNDAGAFAPNSYATRAEAAKMLYGVLKYLN